MDGRNHSITLGAVLIIALVLGAFLVVDLRNVAAESTVPATPTGLSAMPVDGHVFLSWVAPPDGGSPINHYNLYRSTSISGTYALVATSLGLNWTDSGLSAGQIYWYKVTAVNGVGESAQSGAVSVLAPQPISPSNEGAMLIILVVIAIAAAVIAVAFIIHERRKDR
jgi:hypothetical protein